MPRRPLLQGSHTDPALNGTGRLADDLYLLAHHEVTDRAHVQSRALSMGLAGGHLPLTLSWARAFPGVAGQVRAARGFVESLLGGSPFCEDAIFITSELFTNALVHTGSGLPGGLIVVQLSRWRAGVRIAVTDQGSPAPPTVRVPAQPAENGNGLYLVARMATQLTWHDDASGRTVSATLGLPPPAQPASARTPASGDVT